jgi:hypothetical protein
MKLVSFLSNNQMKPQQERKIGSLESILKEKPHRGSEMYSLSVVTSQGEKVNYN